MTEFSQTIDIPYDDLDYSNTKELIDWIIKSLLSIFEKDDKISININYNIGSIHCISDSIDDFINNAYGASEFKLTLIDICCYKEEIYNFIKNGVVIVDPNEITVFAFKKSVLSEMINSLTNTCLTDEEVNNPITNIFNAPVINSSNGNININDSIIGKGNNVINANNSVVGDNNTINKQKKKGIKQFFVNIMQSLLSNGIWYLLSAGIGALIAILFNNKP